MLNWLNFFRKKTCIAVIEQPLDVIIDASNFFLIIPYEEYLKKNYVQSKIFKSVSW